MTPKRNPRATAMVPPCPFDYNPPSTLCKDTEIMLQLRAFASIAKKAHKRSHACIKWLLDRLDLLADVLDKAAERIETADVKPADDTSARSGAPKEEKPGDSRV